MAERRPRREELRFDAEGMSSLRPARIIARDPRDRPLRVGMESHWWRDFYHNALTARWSVFVGCAALAYLAANVVFACLYLLQPDSLDGARRGSFADAFFFSVQTMATIGYGHLLPNTLYANLLVTAETVYGMLSLALASGLMFARFSRPTARVMFSQFAVIGSYEGQPTLAVRVANERRTRILQAEVTATYIRDEVTREGTSMRRFFDLTLARHSTPIFDLTFQVMHAIDAASPLAGVDADRLAADDGEILVTVSGLDETMSQTVHARYSYKAEELRWGHWFVDIFGYTPDGRVALDYRRFHETQEL